MKIKPNWFVKEENGLMIKKKEKSNKFLHLPRKLNFLQEEKEENSTPVTKSLSK